MKEKEVYAIETSKLSKKYGSFYANKEISMQVPQGKVYGLIGRNGAGKTTLMKMLVNLVNPTSGSIKILNEDHDLEKVRVKIGSLIETPAFYDHLSAYANLKTRALLLGNVSANDIDNALKEVGLFNVKNKQVKSFSLGMRERLGIASAILGKPEILILDEPINGLDPIAIKEVRNLLLDKVKKEHVTIIISSHILGELENICDMYGFISNGQLIEEISASDFDKKHISLEDYFIKLLGKEDEN
jgi:ABC-type multidrug transport system ATPase subunit